MSTDIRASLSLSALSAQAARPDSTAQNQILDIGSEAAFPQVLERQTSMRTESRANAGDDAARNRQREEAVDRQPGGKCLPARPERNERNDDRSRADQAVRQSKDVRDSRDTDKPVAKSETAADEHKSTVKKDEAVDAVAEGAQAAAPAEQAQTATTPVALDAAQAAVIVAANAAAAAADTAVLADVVASADATASDALTVSSTTPTVTTEASAVAAELLTGTAADAEQGLAVSGDANANADALSAAVADAAALLEESAAIPNVAVSTTAAPGMGEPSATLPTTQNAKAESIVSPAVAPNLPVTDGASAKQADSSAAAAVSDDAVASGALDAFPDLTPGEKSAESRADADKGPRAMPERVVAFREQLAALAQQVDSGNRAAATSGSKKTDSVQDVKGFALTRNLESLSSARADAGKPVSTGIQTPLSSREWAGEVGQRLLMMVSSKIKSAEIHLNPKELGPMEVRVRMQEDKAHVVFTSNVPQTREALEQAVPKLREMFDQNGVNLGSVNVQDHGAQHSHQRQQADEHAAGGTGSSQSVEEADAVPVARREISLVDFYA